ncbi:MAG: hypothetical protein ACI3XR_04245 [Eubacteriales bacterium]
MDQYNESEKSDISMDYSRNAKFFDEKYMKKYGILRAIGWTLSVIGAVCVLISMFGGRRGLYFFHLIGWPLLIPGVVLLCIVLSKLIKESEITEIMEVKEKRFADLCNEKLGFPSDVSEESMIFTGCDVTSENASDFRKLRSGNFISPRPQITHLYVDLMKKKLCIGSYTYSLIEETEATDFQEIPFSDFDRSEIVTEKVGDIDSRRFVLSLGDKEVFSSPIAASDYYKEEFIGTIIHKKELKR